jgi:hypothetical protein
LPAGESKKDAQARRQKWRALSLCIKAKLERVESKIETFEEAFLAARRPDCRRAHHSRHCQHLSGRTNATPVASTTMTPDRPPPGRSERVRKGIPEIPVTRARGTSIIRDPFRSLSRLRTTAPPFSSGSTKKIRSCCRVQTARCVCAARESREVGNRHSASIILGAFGHPISECFCTACARRMPVKCGPFCLYLTSYQGVLAPKCPFFIDSFRLADSVSDLCPTPEMVFGSHGNCPKLVRRSP